MDFPQAQASQPPLPPLPIGPRRRPSNPPLPPPPFVHRRPSIQHPPSPGPSSRGRPPPPNRQPSDIVLPPWQPDSCVSNCPICHTGFTFWNRRHHCRKCGRVVCHSCSPHRITIPKAFVVQPPPSLPCYPLPAPDTPRNRASWGPNDARRLPDGDEDDGLQVRICDDCLGRRNPIDPHIRTQNIRTVPHRPPPPPPPHYSSLPSRRYYPVPRHPTPFPPAPRLKETDYCPICTLPLPPIGPSGSEDDREAHIQACIRSVEHSVSPARVGSAPGALAGRPEMRARRYTGGARMVVWRAGEKDTWAVEEQGEGEKRRVKAECVICFEDFEEGDVIARLECLCRYHKKCIREWFDRKGNGECPVHAVHE